MVLIGAYKIMPENERTALKAELLKRIEADFQATMADKRERIARAEADLQKLRKELAENRGLLPYKIFSDSALYDMAALRPTSQASFLLVRDITLPGAIRFGKYFVRDIRTWVMTH